jgi:hypothetical protein
VRPQTAPVARDAVVERQAEGRALEQGLEFVLAPRERKRAQVVPAELEQIEGPHECLRLTLPAAQQVDEATPLGPRLGGTRILNEVAAATLSMVAPEILGLE